MHKYVFAILLVRLLKLGKSNVVPPPLQIFIAVHPSTAPAALPRPQSAPPAAQTRRDAARARTPGARPLGSPPEPPWLIFSPFCGATTVTGGAVFDANIGVGVGVDLLDASAIARCARRAEPRPVSKFHVDCFKTRRGIARNVAQNEHLAGLPATGAVGVAPALLGE